VVGDDRAQTERRLALCDAARQVVANGLALMGVTAPQRMDRAVAEVS
jgi:arginyl-tRNA synthetase